MASRYSSARSAGETPKKSASNPTAAAPPPLPLPRLRICCSACSRCRPEIGTLAAMPMTPQPPSASAWPVRSATVPFRGLREAIKLSMSCCRFMMSFFSINQQIPAASQLLHASQSQTAQDSTQLQLERGIQVTDPLGPPIRIDQLGELRVGRGQAKGASSPALAIAAARTAKRNQLGRAENAAIGTQGDGLGNVISGADTTTGHQHYFLADALLDEKTMHLRNCQFDGHRNVLLGNFGRCTCAAIRALDLDDMCASVIASHGYHVNVGGRRYLHCNERVGMNGFNPVDVFLVVLDRIDTVERERREQADPRHAFTHFGNGYCGLIPQQVTTKPRLCSLGIFELDNRRP